jgi:hypothetical protein
VAQLAEQRTRNAQVKSSNLFIGSIRGVAQLGSAFGSGPKGRVFKSPRPDHIKVLKTLRFSALLCFGDIAEMRHEIASKAFYAC